MAVSRILSPEFLRDDDHLSQSRLRGTARSRNRGTMMRRYPRIVADRLSSLCFVLHRMGFFVPRELLRERCALTSPVHPCLRSFQRTGGVFSVTLSVNVRLRERCPRFLRGMLPFGVRTFLQRILRFTSDHLPSAENLSQ